MSETATVAEERPSIKKASCAGCGGPRNCQIKGSFSEAGSDEYMHWKKEWLILQCLGCDFVFCQTVSTDSESYSYQTYEGEDYVQYDETVSYWPALSERPKPAWMSSFGIASENTAKLDPVVVELYKALENDLHILAVIGLRTAFDVASEILGVEANSFREKLDLLVNRGHIGKVDKERLGVLVEAGNASAHRGWSPEATDLQAMMEILEHFIEHAFVAPERQKRLDAQAAKIKGKVPARKKNK